MQNVRKPCAQHLRKLIKAPNVVIKMIQATVTLPTVHEVLGQIDKFKKVKLNPKVDITYPRLIKAIQSLNSKLLISRKIRTKI